MYKCNNKKKTKCNNVEIKVNYFYIRYHHAAVCVPTVRGMFVYGGINSRGIGLKELWKFSLDSNRWSRLNVSDIMSNVQILSTESDFQNLLLF